MNKRIIWPGAVVGLALLAIATAGCEDSTINAPSDGIITLTVTPGTITIDPNDGETEGSALVVAAVFANDGSPIPGVNVMFSSDGGVLASNSQPVVTNGDGLAFDTLTVEIVDPTTITVAVQSSAIIQTTEVGLQVVGSNELPRASIVDIPLGTQDVDKVVTFDGSSSIDPDNAITCYQWVIDSDEDASDEVVQGPAASGLQRTYDVEQSLSVLLRVSDRADAGVQCAANLPPVPSSLFSPFIATISYAITASCANLPPVANAGPDIPATIRLGQNSASVNLNGIRSTDPDGVIKKYLWSCGDGSAPVAEDQDLGTATCAYRVPGTYDATLTVFDDGDRTVNPSGGINCQKQDSDVAVITVTREGS